MLLLRENQSPITGMKTHEQAKKLGNGLGVAYTKPPTRQEEETGKLSGPVQQMAPPQSLQRTQRSIRPTLNHLACIQIFFNDHALLVLLDTTM